MMERDTSVRTLRLRIVVSLCVLVPLGFLVKYADPTASRWMNHHLAGLLYEIFWCLVFFFIFPRARTTTVAVSVFIVTSLLEFLQLWSVPFLDSIRHTWLGGVLLGNTFSVVDFLFYAAGCLLACYYMEWLRNRRHFKRLRS